MKNKDVLNFFISEAEHPFSGWDFSYINDRVVNSPLTWSYTSIILPELRKAESLLDIGTGGGEYLSSLVPLPHHTCATEGYKPNMPIARNQLEPLGVKIVYCKDEEMLPFADEKFDLVINRHESYSPREVYRILKPEGVFITQQVGDKNDSKLRLVLTGKEELEDFVEWNLEIASNELEANGFQIIEGYEDITSTRIFDVGAIIFYFKAIPWELPGFSIKKYYNKLVEVNDYIADKGYLDLDNNNHRFLIKVKKAK
ncbi:MAG: class I SAM-dependent methyltransferase [Promethearchaeota archaeon]